MHFSVLFDNFLVAFQEQINNHRILIFVRVGRYYLGIFYDLRFYSIFGILLIFVCVQSKIIHLKFFPFEFVLSVDIKSYGILNKFRIISHDAYTVVASNTNSVYRTDDVWKQRRPIHIQTHRSFRLHIIVPSLLRPFVALEQCAYRLRLHTHFRRCERDRERERERQR